MAGVGAGKRGGRAWRAQPRPSCSPYYGDADAAVHHPHNALSGRWGRGRGGHGERSSFLSVANLLPRRTTARLQPAERRELASCEVLHRLGRRVAVVLLLPALLNIQRRALALAARHLARRVPADIAARAAPGRGLALATDDGALTACRWGVQWAAQEPSFGRWRAVSICPGPCWCHSHAPIGLHTLLLTLDVTAGVCHQRLAARKPAHRPRRVRILVWVARRLSALSYYQSRPAAGSCLLHRAAGVKAMTYCCAPESSATLRRTHVRCAPPAALQDAKAAYACCSKAACPPRTCRLGLLAPVAVAAAAVAAAPAVPHRLSWRRQRAPRRALLQRRHQLALPVRDERRERPVPPHARRQRRPARLEVKALWIVALLAVLPGAKVNQVVHVVAAVVAPHVGARAAARADHRVGHRAVVAAVGEGARVRARAARRARRDLLHKAAGVARAWGAGCAGGRVVAGGRWAAGWAAGARVWGRAACHGEWWGQAVFRGVLAPWCARTAARPAPCAPRHRRAPPHARVRA